MHPGTKGRRVARVAMALAVATVAVGGLWVAVLGGSTVGTTSEVVWAQAVQF